MQVLRAGIDKLTSRGCSTAHSIRRMFKDQNTKIMNYASMVNSHESIFGTQTTRKLMFGEDVYDDVLSSAVHQDLISVFRRSALISAEKQQNDNRTIKTLKHLINYVRVFELGVRSCWNESDNPVKSAIRF